MTDEQLRNSQPVAEVVSEEEWSSWKQHPTTVIFRGLLKKRIGEISEAWLGGGYTSPMGDQTLQLNSRAIGEVQCLKNLLELTPEEINTGMNDE